MTKAEYENDGEGPFIVTKLSFRSYGENECVQAVVGLTDTTDVVDEFGTLRSASGFGSGTTELSALTHAVNDAGRFFPGIPSQPVTVASHEVFTSENDGEVVVNAVLKTGQTLFSMKASGLTEHAAVACALANGMRISSEPTIERFLRKSKYVSHT